ncbi:Aste57867_12150 [Aphanomyces stellatus]|uniref:Aste57867_12150 protein n=1 Tax=Aphanomyces stellatus TaxID=120398 RepID=A0A485KUU5_9STRA|nr:hypothetical protein As57867_012105 [Aphanomyces stellatus]VFT89004.1 Aste57867_12150 [Aphanomyces stellatus]
MEAAVRAMDATLQRVCRRLDSLEERVDAIPQMDATLNRVCRRLESLEAQVDAISQKVPDEVAFDKLHDMMQSLQEALAVQQTNIANNGVKTPIPATSCVHKATQAIDKRRNTVQGSACVPSPAPANIVPLPPAIIPVELIPSPTAQCLNSAIPPKSIQKPMTRQGTNDDDPVRAGSTASLVDKLPANSTKTTDPPQANENPVAVVPRQREPPAAGASKQHSKVDTSPDGATNGHGLVPVVPCRVLWLIWFKVVPSSSMARPLCVLDPLTLQGNDRKHFDNARSVVQWLIECGLIASEQGALCAMATQELMKVFLKALAHCLDVDDGEIEAGGRPVAHPSFRGMTLNQVASLNYVAIATSLGSWPSRSLVPDEMEVRHLAKRPRTDTATPSSIQTTVDHSRGRLNPLKLPPSTPNGLESSEFTYPITTCRHLWTLWFVGDGAVKLGPLRHVAYLGKSHAHRGRQYAATRVMSRMAATAVHLGLADSKDALTHWTKPMLVSIFDQVFGCMVGVQADGTTLVRPGVEQFTHGQVDGMTYAAAEQLLSRAPTAPNSNSVASNSTNLFDGQPLNHSLLRTNCCALWRLWFHGDMEAAVPLEPLRQRTAACYSNIATRQRWIHAKFVIEWMVKMALANDLAASEDELAAMPPSTGEHAFALAVGMKMDGSLSHPAFKTHQYDQVAAWTHLSVYNRLRRLKPGSIFRTRKSPAKLIKPVKMAEPMKITGLMKMVDSSASLVQRTISCHILVDFPDATCRDTWLYWFHGNDNDVGPLRLYTRRCTSNTKERCIKAAYVMHKIKTAALLHNVVASDEALSDLPREKLLEVFDGAFQRFLDVDATGACLRVGFKAFLFEKVAVMPLEAVWKMLIRPRGN